MPPCLSFHLCHQKPTNCWSFCHKKDKLSEWEFFISIEEAAFFLSLPDLISKVQMSTSIKSDKHFCVIYFSLDSSPPQM